MEKEIFTDFASIRELNSNNKKYLYKEFNTKMGSFDAGKYSMFNGMNIDNILFPIEYVKEDGFLLGYTMKYIDGVSLNDVVKNIPFDKLVEGFKELSSAYETLANSFISLSSLDLVDLMYYKGKIINLGVDNFEKDPSTNILAVRNNSLKKLKKMIYNMYELTTLKPEVLMALKKDVNNYCTVEKMLLNFKENIKKSYGKTISTLSDIKVGDMIGNSYSWANKHW